MSPLTDAISETSGNPTPAPETSEKQEHKSIDDILEKFAEGEDTEEEKTDLLAEEKKDEGDKDPESETGEEDSPADEEKLELGDELATPVRLKQIEKKYPDIFKEFPWMKIAYQRDHQFVEVFPTVEDAKEASERAEIFTKFESALMDGKIDNVFKSLKQSSDESFARVVDNLLPALMATDKDAYFNVVGNVAKSYIASMVREAKTTGNEDLGQAAVLFHQFLFGRSEFEPPKNYGKPAEEIKERSTREEQILQERFQEVSSNLDKTTTNAIRSTIAVNIDPKGQMTDYVKRQAVRDAMEYVESQISSDKATAAQLTRLWNVAREKNFNKASIEDIKRTYLAKAKNYLREGINKARTEALRGTAKVNRDEPEETSKAPLRPGRPAGSSNKPLAEKLKGMTTRQAFDID
jgi:hypothetical protein